VSGLTYRIVPFTGFPHGTLLVNTLGCLVLGYLGAIAEGRQLLSADARLFLMIGLLGSFTTYSTFAHETLGLARDRESLRALANVAAHLLLGLGAVWVGHLLGRGFPGGAP
jgi:CrcB protein